MTKFARIRIKRFVSLSDGVLFFLVCSEVVNIVGYLAVDYATIRSLNEAVWIYASIGCQRTNKTNVRTFRGLNGAHTTIVRSMNVANLEACTFTRQTTRTQSRQTALVRNTCSNIGLVHELRKL